MEFSPAFQGREELPERIRVASATPETIYIHASLTRRRFQFSARNPALKGRAKIRSPLRGAKTVSL
jgi:hypothetical protein